MAIFVEIHAIHSVPPSNLNRDDNGSPKSAFFGGVKRHRVSSQSWKKAIRDHFRDSNDSANQGYRTKNVGDLLVSKVLAANPELDAEKAKDLAINALKITGIIGSKRATAGETTSDALFLVSDAQLESIAQAITTVSDEKELKKELKNSLASNNSLDLALFGRMVADSKELNVEAACQFAHALSTHEVSNEFDFFTAVDDFSVEDHAGAGMMGDVEYNSSTLYRFASVNFTALAKQFGSESESAVDGVTRFIDAFVKSVPTGKQNSFAALTLPEAVLVIVREGQTTSYANAFEKPVAASVGGFSASSVSRLVSYVENNASAYEEDGEATRFAVSVDPDSAALLSRIAETGTLASVKALVTSEISRRDS